MVALHRRLRHSARTGRVRLGYKLAVIALHTGAFGCWLAGYAVHELTHQRSHREALSAAVMRWQYLQLPAKYRRQARRIVKRTARRNPHLRHAYAFAIAAPHGSSDGLQPLYDTKSRTWFGTVLGGLVSSAGQPWYDVTATIFLGGAKGDNITNDGPSEQAAVTQAQADGGGLLFYPRPPVAYLSTQTITISKATVGMVGLGSSFVKLNYNPSVAGDRIRVQQNPFDVTVEGALFRGFTLNGSSAAAGSTGLHYGDVIGGTWDDLHVQNFSGAGSKGVWVDNRTNWTERLIVGRIWVDNNKTSILWDANGGTNSHGYQNWHYIVINVNDGQVCMQLQNGVHFYNGTLVVRGNLFESGSGADLLKVNDTAVCGGNNGAVQFDIQVEDTGGGVPRGITLAAGATLCGSGIIDLGLLTGTSSYAQGATINFTGFFNVPGISAGGGHYVASPSLSNQRLDRLSNVDKRLNIQWLAQGVVQFQLLTDRNQNGSRDFGLFDSIRGGFAWTTETSGAFQLFQALCPSAFGTTQTTNSVWMGSGAPANGNGANGDVYFRTDTPGTANQRIYIRAAGTWTGVV